jgi:hypothetical protein
MKQNTFHSLLSLQEHLPALHSHFQAQGFSVSMFASSWFLTLFATSLSLALTCRVFDVFLSEGLETIFRVGFAILLMSSNELLRRDMEGMIRVRSLLVHSVWFYDDYHCFLGRNVKYNHLIIVLCSICRKRCPSPWTKTLTRCSTLLTK